jgi:DnaJ-domain-containing protein 1
MYESNKNSGVRALVFVTYGDGATENLSIKLPLTSKLNDALNNADAFLDAINAEGKQAFIAKSRIVRIELVEVPKATQMNQHRRENDRAFDPHQVLGVEKGAEAEAVRTAYLALAKKYHPDRFLAMDLPREMLDYAAAMLVRINLAYEQIGN